MKENIKSIEISAINSEIVENERKQQCIYSSFNQNHISNTTDSGSIVTTINYYQKQSGELQSAKKDSKLLTVAAKKLLVEFQDLYVKRKVAENILEERSDRHQQSMHRRSVKLNDELGSMARK